MTTEQLIYNTAVKDGMPGGENQLASFLVYQSKHETGNYEHRFFAVGHNAFGYSYNKNSKWQLDKGGPLADNGVAIAQYRSVEDSVHEITEWIKRRQAEGKFPKDLKSITTTDQYSTLLKNAGYYGAPLEQYATALKNFFLSGVKNFQAKVTANPGTAIIVGISALVIGYGAFLYINRKKINIA